MGKFKVGDMVLINPLVVDKIESLGDKKVLEKMMGSVFTVSNVSEPDGVFITLKEDLEPKNQYHENLFNFLFQPLPQIINIKKENNMKILEIYKERKLNTLFIEYDNKIKEIESLDSIQSLIKDTEEQLNVLLRRENNDKITISINNLHGDNLHEDISQVKIDEAEFNFENERNKVYNLIEEVSALLEMTSDYNEQIKILKKYKILDKEGKLDV